MGCCGPQDGDFKAQGKQLHLDPETKAWFLKTLCSDVEVGLRSQRCRLARCVLFAALVSSCLATNGLYSHGPCHSRHCSSWPR